MLVPLLALTAAVSRHLAHCLARDAEPCAAVDWHAVRSLGARLEHSELSADGRWDSRWNCGGDVHAESANASQTEVSAHNSDASDTAKNNTLTHGTDAATNVSEQAPSESAALASVPTVTPAGVELVFIPPALAPARAPVLLAALRNIAQDTAVALAALLHVASDHNAGGAIADTTTENTRMNQDSTDAAVSCDGGAATVRRDLALLYSAPPSQPLWSLIHHAPGCGAVPAKAAALHRAAAATAAAAAALGGGSGVKVSVGTSASANAQSAGVVGNARALAQYVADSTKASAATLAATSDVVGGSGAVAVAAGALLATLGTGQPGDGSALAASVAARGGRGGGAGGETRHLLGSAAEALPFDAAHFSTSLSPVDLSAPAAAGPYTAVLTDGAGSQSPAEAVVSTVAVSEQSQLLRQSTTVAQAAAAVAALVLLTVAPTLPPAHIKSGSSSGEGLASVVDALLGELPKSVALPTASPALALSAATADNKSSSQTATAVAPALAVNAFSAWDETVPIVALIGVDQHDASQDDRNAVVRVSSSPSSLALSTLLSLSKTARTTKDMTVITSCCQDFVSLTLSLWFSQPQLQPQSQSVNMAPWHWLRLGPLAPPLTSALSAAVVDWPLHSFNSSSTTATTGNVNSNCSSIGRSSKKVTVTTIHEALAISDSGLSLPDNSVAGANNINRVLLSFATSSSNSQSPPSSAQPPAGPRPPALSPSPPSLHALWSCGLTLAASLQSAAASTATAAAASGLLRALLPLPAEVADAWGDESAGALIALPAAAAVSPQLAGAAAAATIRGLARDLLRAARATPLAAIASVTKRLASAACDLKAMASSARRHAQQLQTGAINAGNDTAMLDAAVSAAVALTHAAAAATALVALGGGCAAGLLAASDGDLFTVTTARGAQVGNTVGVRVGGGAALWRLQSALEHAGAFLARHSDQAGATSSDRVLAQELLQAAADIETTLTCSYAATSTDFKSRTLDVSQSAQMGVAVAVSQVVANLAAATHSVSSLWLGLAEHHKEAGANSSDWDLALAATPLLPIPPHVLLTVTSGDNSGRSGSKLGRERASLLLHASYSAGAALAAVTSASVSVLKTADSAAALLDTLTRAQGTDAGVHDVDCFKWPLLPLVPSHITKSLLSPHSANASGSLAVPAPLAVLLRWAAGCALPAAAGLSAALGGGLALAQRQAVSLAADNANNAASGDHGESCSVTLADADAAVRMLPAVTTHSLSSFGDEMTVKMLPISKTTASSKRHSSAAAPYAVSSAITANSRVSLAPLLLSAAHSHAQLAAQHAAANAAAAAATQTHAQLQAQAQAQAQASGQSVTVPPLSLPLPLPPLPTLLAPAVAALPGLVSHLSHDISSAIPNTLSHESVQASATGAVDGPLTSALLRLTVPTHALPRLLPLTALSVWAGHPPAVTAASLVPALALSTVAAAAAELVLASRVHLRDHELRGHSSAATVSATALAATTTGLALSAPQRCGVFALLHALARGAEAAWRVHNYAGAATAGRYRALQQWRALRLQRAQLLQAPQGASAAAGVAGEGLGLWPQYLQRLLPPLLQPPSHCRTVLSLSNNNRAKTPSNDAEPESSSAARIVASGGDDRCHHDVSPIALPLGPARSAAVSARWSQLVHSLLALLSANLTDDGGDGRLPPAAAAGALAFAAAAVGPLSAPRTGSASGSARLLLRVRGRERAGAAAAEAAAATWHAPASASAADMPSSSPQLQTQSKPLLGVAAAIAAVTAKRTPLLELEESKWFDLASPHASLSAPLVISSASGPVLEHVTVGGRGWATCMAALTVATLGFVRHSPPAARTSAKASSNAGKGKMAAGNAAAAGGAAVLAAALKGGEDNDLSVTASEGGNRETMTPAADASSASARENASAGTDPATAAAVAAAVAAAAAAAASANSAAPTAASVIGAGLTGAASGPGTGSALANPTAATSVASAAAGAATAAALAALAASGLSNGSGADVGARSANANGDIATLDAKTQRLPYLAQRSPAGSLSASGVNVSALLNSVEAALKLRCGSWDVGLTRHWLAQSQNTYLQSSNALAIAQAPQSMLCAQSLPLPYSPLGCALLSLFAADAHDLPCMHKLSDYVRSNSYSNAHAATSPSPLQSVPLASSGLLPLLLHAASRDPLPALPLPCLAPAPAAVLAAVHADFAATKSTDTRAGGSCANSSGGHDSVSLLVLAGESPVAALNSVLANGGDHSFDFAKTTAHKAGSNVALARVLLCSGYGMGRGLTCLPANGAVTSSAAFVLPSLVIGSCASQSGSNSRVSVSQSLFTARSVSVAASEAISAISTALRLAPDANISGVASSNAYDAVSSVLPWPVPVCPLPYAAAASSLKPLFLASGSASASGNSTALTHTNMPKNTARFSTAAAASVAETVTPLPLLLPDTVALARHLYGLRVLLLCSQSLLPARPHPTVPAAAGAPAVAPPPAPARLLAAATLPWALRLSVTGVTPAAAATMAAGAAAAAATAVNAATVVIAKDEQSNRISFYSVIDRALIPLNNPLYNEAKAAASAVDAATGADSAHTASPGSGTAAVPVLAYVSTVVDGTTTASSTARSSSSPMTMTKTSKASSAGRVAGTGLLPWAGFAALSAAALNLWGEATAGLWDSVAASIAPEQQQQQQRQLSNGGSDDDVAVGRVASVIPALALTSAAAYLPHTLASFPHGVSSLKGIVRLLSLLTAALPTPPQTLTQPSTAAAAAALARSRALLRSPHGDREQSVDGDDDGDSDDDCGQDWDGGALVATLQAYAIARPLSLLAAASPSADSTSTPAAAAAASIVPAATTQLLYYHAAALAALCAQQTALLLRPAAPAALLQTATAIAAAKRSRQQRQRGGGDASLLPQLLRSPSSSRSRTPSPSPDNNNSSSSATAAARSGPRSRPRTAAVSPAAAAVPGLAAAALRDAAGLLTVTMALLPLVPADAVADVVSIVEAVVAAAPGAVVVLADRAADRVDDGMAYNAARVSQLAVSESDLSDSSDRIGRSDRSSGNSSSDVTDGNDSDSDRVARSAAAVAPSYSPNSQHQASSDGVIALHSIVSTAARASRRRHSSNGASSSVHAGTGKGSNRGRSGDRSGGDGGFVPPQLTITVINPREGLLAVVVKGAAEAGGWKKTALTRWAVALAARYAVPVQGMSMDELIRKESQQMKQ